MFAFAINRLFILLLIFSPTEHIFRNTYLNAKDTCILCNYGFTESSRDWDTTDVGRQEA